MKHIARLLIVVAIIFAIGCMAYAASPTSARTLSCSSDWQSVSRNVIVDLDQFTILGYVEALSDGCGRVKGHVHTTIGSPDRSVTVSIVDPITGDQRTIRTANQSDITSAAIATNGRVFIVRGTIESQSDDFSASNITSTTNGYD
ncbi:MAG: hypothetical protein J2P36_20005 [Ktedonobacteraceae bacterium]|nr:hypothetical protein [Ktedonobacteraceae bacterium]